MAFYVNSLYETIASPEFLLIVILISVAVKTYFLSILVPQGLRSSTKILKPLIFLIGILAGSMFGDIAWITKIIHRLFYPETDYSFVALSIRVAWAFVVLQYQSLAFFIESLSEKNFTLKFVHKILLATSIIFCFYFFYLSFFDCSLTSELARKIAKEIPPSEAPLEINMMRYVVYYLINLIIFPSLYFTIKKMRYNNLPKILKKQLSVFIRFLLGPYLITEFLQMTNFLFESFEHYLVPIISLSTLLLTCTVYYCIQQVMGLRFLNFVSQVQSDHSFNFIDDFKNILEQLSHATSLQELGHLTQNFFKDAFDISMRKTTLYIRKTSSTKERILSSLENNKVETTVETFMSNHDQSVCAFINQHKVLIYDEIAFSNFYEEDTVKKSLLNFLDIIDANVFLPIYEKQKIVAYIIVERHARSQEFYSNVEHDEMLVFASYLGNILHLLKNRNFESIIQQEKELKEELYAKHQEINHYKESIRSFLKKSQKNKIGIMFYKARRFIFGNQAAKELIQLNVNMQEGHPLTQALKKIARQVEEYKASQTCFTNDVDGNKLVLCGVPNLEQNNVIITVYYPEISDIIAKQIDRLKDPTTWDYLLCLETTRAGKLINQHIPGSEENFTSFKIDLLKCSMNRKALLLEMPEEDLLPMVKLLHHLSLRESLHILNLQGREKNFETALKLFGSSPTDKALFKKLNKTGTLFIQNIQFLDWQTQEYLAEYIQYGCFRPFKSDQKIASSVRVICSTNQSLSVLVQEGKFSKKLYDEFQKNHLSMPSLLTLPEEELDDLINSFMQQAIKSDAYKNLLGLSKKERIKLAVKRPASLQELKTKIQTILINKSKKNHINQETQFDPAYAITDPELTQAARLGKHALRDERIMVMLWNKFKNQNKIAMFLGVNRSSVNRRCKKYNLQ